MKHRLRLAMSFFAAGIAISGATVAYLLVSYPNRSEAALKAIGYLCPPSALANIFLDIQGTNTEWTILWVVIALINGSIYGAIGLLIGKFLWRSN